MRLFLVPMTLVCCILSPVWAGEPKPQLSLCAEDSPVCRKLAIEITKLDLSDFIDRELDLRRSGSFLCPEDNPQCCPPRLMPLCSQIEKDLVAEERRRFQSMVAARFDDCPWDSETCDSLGPFYCGPEGGWTPLGGCSSDIVIDPGPSFPIDSRLSCPCGTIPHPRKGCIREICTFRGIPILCSPTCNDLFLAASSPNRERIPESNLERHLKDQRVQLEAAKQVRENLKAALGALEEHIRELSQYKAKK